MDAKEGLKIEGFLKHISSSGKAKTGAYKLQPDESGFFFIITFLTAMITIRRIN